MQVLGFILLLLLDVRAHIPNQPSFGSGPTRVPSGAPPVRAVTAFFIKAAFVGTLVWLAVRLVSSFAGTGGV